ADRPEPKGTGSGCYLAHREHMGAETPGEETEPALTLCMLSGTTAAWRLQIENRPGSSCCCRTPRRICML
ncbi:hypothetical protein, partial [Escherichia coli]